MAANVARAAAESLPYVFLAEYNGTGATGGDPLVEDLNIWYEVRRSATGLVPIRFLPLCALLDGSQAGLSNGEPPQSIEV